MLRNVKNNIDIIVDGWVWGINEYLSANYIADKQ